MCRPTCRARASQARRRAGAQLDKFEREAGPFFERVRGAYLERVASDPRRFRVIDSTRPLAAVRDELAAHLAALDAAVTLMADERDDAGDGAGAAVAAPLPWQLQAMRGGAGAARDAGRHALLIHGRAASASTRWRSASRRRCCANRRAPTASPAANVPAAATPMAGQHPDLMRLELIEIDPEDGELKPVDTITIPRIRALIEFVTLTSHRQRAKVGVIAPAERMNAQAANALLKTLEEPPPGTFLILAADQPGLLPATIGSRCRRFAAPQPDGDEAHAWLAAQGVADPALALAQAAGAPRVALELADPERQAERKVWLTALARPERLAVIALSARIDAGARDERRARLARAIDWLLAWTADLARAAAGDTARRNPDSLPRLAGGSRRRLRKEWILIHMLGKFHGINGEFDVHATLHLAMAAGVGEVLDRFRDHVIAVVVEPIDQGPDRRIFLILDDRGVVERAKYCAATVEFLEQSLVIHIKTKRLAGRMKISAIDKECDLGATR